MRFRQRVIHPGGFFEFDFVRRVLGEKFSGRLRAFPADGLNFKNEPGHSAYRQADAGFGFSHTA